MRQQLLAGTGFTQQQDRRIALRRPLTTSPALASVMARLREDVAELVEDRYMAPDLDAGARLVATGALAEASGIRLPGLG